MHRVVDSTSNYSAATRKTMLPRPRPRSAHRTNENFSTRTGLYPCPQRPLTKNKASFIPKKVTSTNASLRSGTPIVVIPSTKKCNKSAKGVGCAVQGQSCLEPMFVKHIEKSERVSGEKSDRELSTNNSIEIMKNNYEEKAMNLEKLKKDLFAKQKSVTELQLTMEKIRNKMKVFGFKFNPSEPEDNINYFDHGSEKIDIQFLKSIHSLDVKKLNKLPDALITTCEQTLRKRMDIINWLDRLVKSDAKGIQGSTLINKIKEYAGENDMLKCSLNKAKEEFIIYLNDILSCLNKNTNDTTALHLRNEGLIHDIAERDAKIASLRKQLQTCEQLKPHSTRAKVEELEKALTEEKCKRLVIKNRMVQAEGQIKMSTNRATQLEDTLEQARTQIWNLERTNQQLREENMKLQSEFEQELCALTSSIKENTAHLEEIGQDREKLQTEKEDLERRLEELSENYNKSMQSMKQDLKNNTAKVIESEQRLSNIIEEKNKLENKLDNMNAQVLEAQIRYKDLCKEMENKQCELEKYKNNQIEIDEKRREVENINEELIKYKDQFNKHENEIKDLKAKLKEFSMLESNLKMDLKCKEDYIATVEHNQIVLKQQLQESELKMENYEEQLLTLQAHIHQLQEDLGQFDNLSELRDMVSNQRAQLQEATRLNGELALTIKKKDSEIVQHVDNLNEQMQIIMQKEDDIIASSKKEEEQSNVITVLRNKLDYHAKIEDDLNTKLAEKDAELLSVISSLDTMKQQISQLEKIILTLEDQNHKVITQRRIDQDKIEVLKKSIDEYEAYYLEAQKKMSLPEDKLDNLIKALEDELNSPFDSEDVAPCSDYKILQKNYSGDCRKKKNIEKYRSRFRPVTSENKSFPTKVVMGNFVKKTYNISSDEKSNTEKLDRKKAITNIGSGKLTPPTGSSLNVLYDKSEEDIKCRGAFPPYKMLPSFMPRQLSEDKKYSKMLKLAGHRL